MFLVALPHVESSWARDQTHILCIGRQSLNYQTTREVPYYRFFICVYHEFIYVVLQAYLFVLNWEPFKFRHILKYWYNLLHFSTFYVFQVIFYNLIYISELFIVVTVASKIFFFCIFVVDYFVGWTSAIIVYLSFLEEFSLSKITYFPIREDPLVFLLLSI